MNWSSEALSIPPAIALFHNSVQLRTPSEFHTKNLASCKLIAYMANCTHNCNSSINASTGQKYKAEQEIGSTVQ